VAVVLAVVVPAACAGPAAMGNASVKPKDCWGAGA
jgi:hypothetical protein